MARNTPETFLKDRILQSIPTVFTHVLIVQFFVFFVDVIQLLGTSGETCVLDGSLEYQIGKPIRLHKCTKSYAERTSSDMSY